MLPLVAYLEKAFGIVGDDPVQLLLDAPPHHVLLVDRPAQNGPALGPGVAQELGADRAHEHPLDHVEGNVGNGEEFAGVGDGEADVGDGEGG